MTTSYLHPTLLLMTKQTILCVDDEVDNLDALERIFRKKYQVLRANSGIEALALLDQHPDLELATIVTDQRMPTMTGVDFLEKTLERFPDTSRILLTGYTDLESVISAVNKGQIFRYLTKPWDPVDLANTVDQAVAKYNLAKELASKNLELSKALQDLRSLDKAKSNFMILINHELKTPLTSLISFSALLAESRLDEEQNLMLSRIQKAADRLKSLVDDVLLIVRAETNQLKIDLAPFQVMPFEDQLLPDLKKLLTQKNQTLRWQFETVTVHCDQRLVRQVLTRLIHNAAKFGENGSAIVIESQSVADRVEFSVTNQGAPIAAKILAKIYNPFYIDEDVMNHSTGMGLGLTICQSILKFHSSQLKFENLDKAVRVSFSLSKLSE